ncbi:hypothetical protein VPH35_047021 [Triticum aestivum]
MASQTNESLFLMGDEFVADEILARLPARHAVRCVLLSNRFRELLTLPHFWRRHRRLGAHSELPRAACLYRLDKRFYFHAVGPTFAVKHTVGLDRGTYAGTCDGWSSWPPIPMGGRPLTALSSIRPPRRRCGSPCRCRTPERAKAYKALIYQGRPRQHGIRAQAQLMVVPLDGAAAPRTVFSSDHELLCDHSLHMGDGKVYFLMYRWYSYFDSVEDIEEEHCDVTSMLIFDVDSEAITSVAAPAEEHISFSMMLDTNGRPCIYRKDDQETVVWLLTPDHRWERMLSKKNRAFTSSRAINGTTTLFAKFRDTGAYLYNLCEADERGEGGRLVPMSSMKIDYETPKPLKGSSIFVPASVELWDYQPTLISPASIFGGAKFPGRRESFTLEHELEEVLLEVTRKVIVDQAMQMLSMAGAPQPAEVTHTMAITDAGRQQADQEEKADAKDTK